MDRGNRKDKMQPSNTVRILAHTFKFPTGEIRTVACDKPYTSRNRASHYVKNGTAKWEDERQETIYFLDPLILLEKAEARRTGAHQWYVGDSGGSSLMKAGTARGRKAGVSGGYRVLQTRGGEKSFMDAE